MEFKRYTEIPRDVKSIMYHSNLAARKAYRSLARHQERYLKAWMAQTGIPPDEAEMVVEYTFNGMRIFFRRKEG